VRKYIRLIPVWRQALAAVGQGRLIALWDNLFGQLGQPIAQILLTRGDISDVRSSLLLHPCIFVISRFKFLLSGLIRPGFILTLIYFFAQLQRTRYLNAVNTLSELLSMGVVPIINENDTVSVSVSMG